MKILVLGVSGMLGSTLYHSFARDPDYSVTGTARSESTRDFFPGELRNGIVSGIDVLEETALEQVFELAGPDVVINCVGLIKQLDNANDPLEVLPINSMYPHRLSRTCARRAARLVHVSTDCVFDGSKGNYRETDVSDATDLYGKSKYIGEISDQPHAITLRTSIIGHELNSRHGLIEWFLAQSGSVKGFRRAIFSGLPTVELSRVIRDYVIPRPDLSGLYHVSSEPISKYDLLGLVAEIYGKEIEIIPDDDVAIDRSLNSERFKTQTGYEAPSWPTLIREMKDSKIVVGD